MKKWLRRFTYLLIIIVWLFFMSLPALAFFVSMNGQVQIGNDTRNHLRIFLLEDAEEEGVGIEWTRPIRSNHSCSRTNITYLLWEGETEPIRYCQCFDELTGDVLPPHLSRCE